MCGDGQILYGMGLGLFGVAAYFYHFSVKYMVKIGTPVPNGYQVKTLCTHGPFQYFQHPIYCALFGCSLSTPLVLDSACTTPTPTKEGGRERARARERERPRAREINLLGERESRKRLE